MIINKASSILILAVELSMNLFALHSTLDWVLAWGGHRTNRWYALHVFLAGHPAFLCILGTVLLYHPIGEFQRALVTRCMH